MSKTEPNNAPVFPDDTVQRLVVDGFGGPQEHQVDMSLLNRFATLLGTATTIVTRAGRLQAQGVLTEQEVKTIKVRVRATLANKLKLDTSAAE
jgi:hypothetical protein